MFKYALIEDGKVKEYRTYHEVVEEHRIRKVNGLLALRPVEEIMPDYDANVEVLDGPKVTIRKDKVVHKYTTRPKTDDEIEIMRKNKIRAVNKIWKEKTKAWITFNNAEYDTDALTLFPLTLSTEYVTTWFDVNDVPVIWSPSDVANFLSDVANRNEACSKKRALHINIIRGLSSAKDIAEYDINQGW